MSDTASSLSPLDEREITPTPCPFCGMKWDGPVGRYVEHPRAECPLSGNVIRITMWNRRAPQSGDTSSTSLDAAIAQLALCEYRDKHGHPLENNEGFASLVELAKKARKQIPYEIRLYDRADGLKGHYCIGRIYDGIYHEFWSDEARKFCSAGSVFTLEEAQSRLKSVSLAAPAQAPAAGPGSPSGELFAVFILGKDSARYEKTATVRENAEWAAQAARKGIDAGERV